MKKNILNKLLFILTAIIFILLLMTIKSDAASISISTSKSSVSPGGTFTVTVSVNGGAGKVKTTVSNGTGGKTDFLDNGSYSFTCTAGSSGSVTITSSGSIADYSTEKESTKSASRTVSIVKSSSGGSSGGSSSSGSSSSGSTSNGGYSNSNSNKTNTEKTKKSSDNTLTELSVKEGKITPDFKKDVKEYALTIPYETSEINVTATPSDSNATIEVKGNKKLKEGENTVTVAVTAEDGSTSNYIIKVTRKRVPVALKSLIIKYKNENGELVEIPLNPVFAFDTIEYTLSDLESNVENLEIEAIPNIEGAEINIEGANNLKEGENTINITLKALEDKNYLKEGEEPKEETITYTIKVNKKAKPTIMENISNWYNQNEKNVILGALGVCILALLGLSIYIVIDYNKYKNVIVKNKKTAAINKTENIIEQIHKNSKDIQNKTKDDDKSTDNTKGGKHF